ncbi:MAG: type II toxin-antitoxin system VapC family toxin [Porphyrobacter sp.]|nr:type II toxin-antitoxin system VapC family toxin [Porphyrobacter sp.]
MRAIDTNVLVRFLAGDDPQQSAKARKIIEDGEVYVAVTVFLEAEWVLRSTYGFSPVQICSIFEAFAGLPGVTVEDPDLLALAIALARDGLDFADALHLGRAQGCTAFVTFDRKLVRAAKGLSPVATELA